MNRSPVKNKLKKLVKNTEEKRLHRSPSKPFYRDIATIMASYYRPRYKLRSWIPEDSLVMTDSLVKNPKAIYLLKDHLERIYTGPNGKIITTPNIKIPRTKKINFDALAENPELMVILDSHPELWDCMNLVFLAKNLSVVITDLVLRNLSKLPKEKQPYVIYQLYSNPNMFGKMPEPKNESEKFDLYMNPKAGDLLYNNYIQNPVLFDDSYLDQNFWLAICSTKHASKVIEAEYKSNRKSFHLVWNKISENPSLIDLIKIELKHPNSLVRWDYLNYNENAVNILQKHPNKIDYFMLSFNPSPKAVIMCIEKYKETLNTDVIDGLSKNPYAIDFFEKNPHLIDMKYLSSNPGIFIEDKPDRDIIKFFEDLEL